MSTDWTTVHGEGEWSVVLAEYLAALDRGEGADRAALLARHPHLADQMRAFFASQDGLERFTAPLRGNDSPADLPPPFDLLEEIGRGGMGIILRGRDRILDRDLAVKVLLERFRDSPDLVRRFIEEARITGRLQHPFIVPVHELGTLPDGRPYFAMKLIQGRTFAELLAERPDPTDNLPVYLKVFEQVCQTLAYAHSRGVIHRDLKPANVMVGAFGEVQVMDWGLAKQLVEDEFAGSDNRETEDSTLSIPVPLQETSAGSVLGTPAFMPPEQACGEGASIDRRSDVFGLGAILCSILTGQPPYTGEKNEVREKARNGRTEEAVQRLLVCGAEGELVELACRCLAANPQLRPADGSAVASAMTAYFAAAQERLRSAEIARTRAETEASEERKRVTLAEAKATAEEKRAVAERRHRRATLLLAASLLLLLGGGALFGLWYQRHHARQETVLASRRSLTERDVTAALGEARVLHEEGLKQANQPDRWRVTLKAARSAWKHAEESLEHGAPTDFLREQVAEMWADLEQDERDCRLLTELDRLQLDWGTFKDEDSGCRFVVRRSREIFASSGLDLGKEATPEAITRLRCHRFRNQIVEGIESWARAQATLAGPKEVVLTPTRDQEAMVILSLPDWTKAERLLQLLEALEPAPNRFRSRWREARTRRDGPALARLADAPEALALAPLGLCNLAHDLRSTLQSNAATRLLRKGLARHHDDFWLNLNMGDLLMMGDSPAADEALRYLSAARALRSQIPLVYIQLARAYFDKGEAKAALHEARAAIAVDPHFVPSHNLLGFLLWNQGEFDEAIRCLRHANSLDPASAITCHTLGSCLLDKGEWKEALTWLSKAVELEPQDFNFHNSLGNALREKGDLDAAILSFQAALKIAPLYPPARIGLGMARLQKKDIKGALAEFQTAIEKTPKDPAAYYKKGDLLLLRGERADALQCYSMPIELNPKSVDAHLQRSYFLVKLGDMPGALASARKAREVGPRSVAAHAGLIVFLLKSGNVEEAFRRSEEAVLLFPDAAELRHSLGMALYSRGDLDQAIQSIRLAIERQPPRGVFHGDLGLALRARGDLENALAEFRTAIRLTPKGGDWHWVFAETLFGMHRLEEALNAVEEAVKLNPYNPHSALLRATILIANGDYEQARKELGRVQALLPFLDPRHGNVRELLGLCERLEKARQKLPAILAGQEKPANGEEQLALGMICARSHRKAHAVTAVRFFTEAFAAQKLNAQKPYSNSRFQAACCAILAGTGQSDDSKDLDPGKQAELRRQARNWLQADLVGMQKTIASRKPIAYPPVQFRLWQWKTNQDLAAVRDPLQRRQLPTEEAEAWQAFWAEVEALSLGIGAHRPKPNGAPKDRGVEE